MIARYRLDDVRVGHVLPEAIEVEARLVGDSFHDRNLVDVEAVAMSSVKQGEMDVLETVLAASGFRRFESQASPHEL